MKKKMAMLLIASMMMSLGVGCGSGTNSSAAEGAKRVAIIQYMEHPSLDTIRESTIETLKEQGFVDGENIIIDYQNAQGDQSNLNSIASKFVGNKADVIIAIATPAAQSVAAATTKIPIVFSGVTDPVAAKLVDNLESPSGNVTGTSDAIPMDQLFELCEELTPDVKTFGFLYTASEGNSQSVVNEAKELAGQYGFDYEESTITAINELQQAAEILAGKVDAIYVPIDNNVASAMPVLANVGKKAGIPVYVGADSMVEDGGYATIGINYEDLGAKTGEMVASVLDGKQISEIPVATLDNFRKVINKTTAKAIGAPENAEGATIVE